MLAGWEAHAPLCRIERLEKKITGFQFCTGANIGESCLACVCVANQCKQGHRRVLHNFLVLEVINLDLKVSHLILQFSLALAQIITLNFELGLTGTADRAGAPLTLG